MLEKPNVGWCLFLSSASKLLSPTPRQSLPHTLDQASAQFAASALVTADQLLALKTKEELGPGGGVNGVLSPSGMRQTIDGRRGLKTFCPFVSTCTEGVVHHSNSLSNYISMKWSLVLIIDCSVCLWPSCNIGNVWLLSGCAGSNLVFNKNATAKLEELKAIQI